MHSSGIRALLSVLAIGPFVVTCGPVQPAAEDPAPEPPLAVCEPLDCASAGVACGSVDDGCGGTLSCGECSDQTCTPKSCEELEVTCGQAEDGCGAVVDCGPCNDTPSPDPAPCVPKTCEDLRATCGEPDDGCGGTLSCGGCSAPEVCGGAFTYDCAECRVFADLGARVPVFVSGDTYAGMLRSGSTPLPFAKWLASYVTFKWRAPRTGAYVLPMSHVAVRMGTCSGPAPAATGNRVELQAGDTLFLTIFRAAMMFDVIYDDYAFSISRWEPREVPDGAADPGVTSGTCANRLDDDADGLGDCWDPDCTDAPECVSEACADVDLRSELPAHHSVLDQPATPSEQPHDDGKEFRRTYRWVAPHDGTFRVMAGGPEGFEPGQLELWRTCVGPVLEWARDLYAPEVTVTLRQGEPVVIVLEGAQFTSYRLSPVPTGLRIEEVE